ncbi:MAG: hypothetical protein DWQ19_08895 [Crenarchaeota archaeon]|nr:MAG: hypothetical protein DWQ19_08895 [Thermoproteota archaeon]
MTNLVQLILRKLTTLYQYKGFSSRERLDKFCVIQNYVDNCIEEIRAQIREEEEFGNVQVNPNGTEYSN